MLGKLTWEAVPLDQPIPLIAGAMVGFGIFCRPIWIVLKGYLPYLWKVDHQRRS